MLVKGESWKNKEWKVEDLNEGRVTVFDTALLNNRSRLVLVWNKVETGTKECQIGLE